MNAKKTAAVTAEKVKDPLMDELEPQPKENPVLAAQKIVAKQATESVKDVAARRIIESREALKHPAPPGQKFFEAPDGYIVVAEQDRDHVPERRPGKAWGLLNPRR